MRVYSDLAGTQCIFNQRRLRLARACVGLLLAHMMYRMHMTSPSLCLLSTEQVSMDIRIWLAYRFITKGRGVEIVKFSTCPGTSKWP